MAVRRRLTRVKESQSDEKKEGKGSLFLVASLLLVAMHFAPSSKARSPSSFLLLLVRHLLLEAMHLFLVASCYY